MRRKRTQRQQASRSIRPVRDCEDRDATDHMCHASSGQESESSNDSSDKEAEEMQVPSMGEAPQLMEDMCSPPAIAPPTGGAVPNRPVFIACVSSATAKEGPILLDTLGNDVSLLCAFARASFVKQKPRPIS